MKNSRVFVIQTPARKDGPHRWIEKYDLSAAEVFGRLVYILGHGNVPNDPGPIRIRLKEVFFDPDNMFDYDIDYVLLLGDPVAIAWAISVLEGRRPAGKFIRVLKWDRRNLDYLIYNVG